MKMNNLFSAELYKWKKSRGFYICLLSAVCCIVIIWLSFLLADRIESGQIENGTMGITVSQETLEEGQSESFLDAIGIMQIVQTFIGGGFSTLFIAIFICIWVIGEYGKGAAKNVVGKGYSRNSIFLTKYFSSILISLVLDIAIVIASVLTGMAVMGTARIEENFFKDCLAYVGVQLMLSVAFSGIIAAIGEFTRNLAAGIGISILLTALSSTFANGLDLLFRAMHIDFRVSAYWITNVIENCPIEGINIDVVGSAIAVTIMWTVISLFAGMVHFHEADV
ncbi:MAG: ABC transporter permease [Lachnospiraceae bacterium]|nr:ABC transporter permease [Lachnospiraceae bacterium]